MKVIKMEEIRFSRFLLEDQTYADRDMIIEIIAALDGLLKFLQGFALFLFVQDLADPGNVSNQICVFVMEEPLASLAKEHH